MKYVFFSLLIVLTQSISAQTNLEQFLNHPAESNFVSSTDGKNIAWVINDAGKRNIMIRMGSELPRMLTDYQQDDGQEISQLTFSPNGTKLIYVRGGEANQKGQNPNPAGLAEGTEQAIYFKDMSSKSSPAKIAQGSSPTFNPDGLKILFAKGGQIYETSLEINAAPKPLFVGRGNNYNPKFSPSGNEILFTSDRGDHSFIGVYSTVTKKVRWISPDISNDAFPNWSPDGKQIVFIRMAGVKINQSINYLDGMKFSICVADADALTSKVIWKSPADDGGFAQERDKPLAWTSMNRILFFLLFFFSLTTFFLPNYLLISNSNFLLFFLFPSYYLLTLFYPIFSLLSLPLLSNLSFSLKIILHNYYSFFF